MLIKTAKFMYNAIFIISASNANKLKCSLTVANLYFINFI